MNCPETLMFERKWLQIWLHQRADVPWKYVSWAEALNPFRYEICVGRGPGQFWHINEDAVLWRKWRNFIFHVRKMCWLRGHDWRELNSFQQPTMMCDRCMKIRPMELD